MAVDTTHAAAERGLESLEDLAQGQIAQQLEDAMLVSAVEHERLANVDVRKVLGDRTQQGSAALGVGRARWGRWSAGAVAVCDPQIVAVKVCVRPTEGEARLPDLDCFEHAGMRQLLDHHLHLERARRLGLVRLDAPNEERARLLNGGHEPCELRAELLAHSGCHAPRGAAAILRVRLLWKERLRAGVRRRRQQIAQVAREAVRVLLNHRGDLIRHLARIVPHEERRRTLRDLWPPERRVRGVRVGALGEPFEVAALRNAHLLIQ